MKITRKFVATLAAVSIVLSGPVTTLAATTSATGAGVNGYKVSPVRTDITVNPGQTQEVTVTIQNVSDSVEELQTIVNDFEAKDESGTPALLLNGQNAPQHGLKQYVTVPNGNFTLQPNEQKTVIVDVTIPKGAAGGGYYGAIRFAPAGGSGNQNVNLSASVTSLILARVSGNVIDNLSIASFNTQKKPVDATVTPSAGSVFTNGKNIQVAVRFQNEGNVQEAPFGKIIVMKGSKTIDTQEINNSTERSNVLPNSIRRYTVDLHNTTSYGKYTVEGNFGYGSKGQLLSAKSTFYVVPLALIIAVIAIIVVIIALIFIVPRVRKNYRVVRNNRR